MFERGSRTFSFLREFPLLLSGSIVMLALYTTVLTSPHPLVFFFLPPAQCVSYHVRVSSFKPKMDYPAAVRELENTKSFLHRWISFRLPRGSRRIKKSRTLRVFLFFFFFRSMNFNPGRVPTGRHRSVFEKKKKIFSHPPPSASWALRKLFTFRGVKSKDMLYFSEALTGKIL